TDTNQCDQVFIRTGAAESATGKVGALHRIAVVAVAPQAVGLIQAAAVLYVAWCITVLLAGSRTCCSEQQCSKRAMQQRADRRESHFAISPVEWMEPEVPFSVVTNVWSGAELPGLASCWPLPPCQGGQR